MNFPQWNRDCELMSKSDADPCTGRLVDEEAQTSTYARGKSVSTTAA
jgi:hypothetical protein